MSAPPKQHNPLSEPPPFSSRQKAELSRLRQMRDRIEIWVNAFNILSADNGQVTTQSVLQLWSRTLCSHLGFQAAGAFRVELDTGRASLLAGQPADQFPDTVSLSLEVRRLLFDWQRGSFEANTPQILIPFSKECGLSTFHWVTFRSGHGMAFLLTAGFFPHDENFRPLTEGDQSHFSMVGNLLATRLDKIILISEAEQDRLALRKMNVELDRSLRDLRKTQEELLLSTRLASVGEMAGRTAHEVLNPISSIHGRLTQMISSLHRVYHENLDVFTSVLDAWREGYSKGGISGLAKTLAETVGETEQTFFENDLQCLESLRAFFATEREQQLEGLRFLLKEVNRVVRIVDGMRSLTRQSGSRKRVLLAPTLEEAFETLRDALVKRRIELVLKCDPSLALFLDRYELIQVLTNLMRNAMFAIEEKTGREGGRIAVSATKRGAWLDIRVTDTGTGIPKSHLPKLFDASFSSRSTEQGTGLGLSISRRLVYGFGGEISVEKTVLNEGTTFLVTLPLYSKVLEAQYQASSIHDG